MEENHDWDNSDIGMFADAKKQHQLNNKIIMDKGKDTLDKNMEQLLEFAKEHGLNIEPTKENEKMENDKIVDLENDR